VYKYSLLYVNIYSNGIVFHKNINITIEEILMPEPIKKNTNDSQEPSLCVVCVSVRDFVSFVYREGGLGNTYSYESSGSDKTLHSRFIKSYINKFKDKNYQSEVTLKTEYKTGSFLFKISGRADILLVDSDTISEVIEIKGLYNSAEGVFPDKADILHLAQAKIYAYILCRELIQDNRKVKITICYVSSSNFKAKYFEYEIEFEELNLFFIDTCKYFEEIYKNINQYKFIRDKSIKNQNFPYLSLRSGQKNFMKTVLDSIKTKKPIIIQAPTGTGKTVSSLYPAIKSIPHNFSDYVFYLTAKNSTQEVAKQSLNDMRKNGLIIKSIQITAKEKQCLCKDIYCDVSICKYATGYYNKSRAALKEILKFDAIDSIITRQIAQKYDVCPFEISLDASLFSDIIICDYNYFFDPRIMLERFCFNDLLRLTVLVDESHNLPARANDMYSTELLYSGFIKLYEIKNYLTEKSRISLENIYLYFSNLSSFFNPGENEITVFDKSIPENSFFKSGNVCASRNLPKVFVKLLNEFIISASENFDKLQDPEQKKSFKSFYFDSKYFLRVAFEFFNDSYITYIVKTNNDILISVKCLDSSEMLTKRSNGKNSLCFFSATLQPVVYFKKLLHSSKTYGDEIDFTVFPSPFPPENLFVGVFGEISVKYANRRETLTQVRDIIKFSTGVKKGNYIVFSPSFEYMEWISSLLEENFESEKVDIIKQKRDMQESERENFLIQFKSVSEKSLVAFAVLGGVFSEGIDLVGEYLSGVIIVGVGIPQNDVYNEILKDYYSSIFGNGYDFAYRFPGFNKILQAAGRVIRTENDRGFVILIDERYQTPEYSSLFPLEWNISYLNSPEEIKEELTCFFKE